MSKNVFNEECGVALYELSGSELDAVAGGALLGIFSLNIEGQSSLEVLSHWKNGILAEQISQYQSVSSGSFSINI